MVVGPGLQVLQGVERGVVQAQGVLLQGLAQGLLEGFLLELQHQSVGLLPLSLPLLRSLSPGDTLHLNFYIYSFSRRSYPERLTVSTGIYPPEASRVKCPRTERHLHSRESNWQPSDSAI